MEKMKCKICGKEVSKNNSYIGSHVKRKHGILLNDYVKKYYINLNNIKERKCNNCNKILIPLIKIDHDNFTYEEYYEGFLCDNDECKNNISLKILGTEYNKKTYEHIGSKSEYLSLKYDINLNDAKNMKYSQREILESHKVTLEGYILRYGEKNGTKKYKERCDKISESNTLDWYVKKFGLKLGTKKWNSYRDKMSVSLNGYISRYGDEIGTKKYKERCDKISKSNNIDWYIKKFGEKEGSKKWKSFINKVKSNKFEKISKKSLKIKNYLDFFNIDFIQEYNIPGLRYNVDYYLPKENIIIEFFGDYWHCNPKLYEKSYYNNRMKITSEEQWQHDKERIKKIKSSYDNEITIIILWENTMENIDKYYLLKIINDNKNKNVIIEI